MKLVIFDGNAIIHRAYHAIPPLTTKDGIMVNAVYGFASMLLRVLKDLNPEYVAVTFDMSGGTFRHEKFDGYKAKRVKADQALYDQIPLVHELVEAFKIPIFEKKGYEADDVIGTIATCAQQEKVNGELVETYVVSGDMDTLQLVTDHVKVYTLRMGLNDVVIYDPAKVQERYGFGPEYIVDYKSLRGDTSDNIPGVPGIGEKTATELIQKFGSLEKIYVDLKQPDSRIKAEMKPGVVAKLMSGEESAQMSKFLATIDCHVPEVDFTLAKSAFNSVPTEEVIKIFDRFEFSSLLKRIPRSANQTQKKSPATPKAKKVELEEHPASEIVEQLKEAAQKQKFFGCQVVRSARGTEGVLVVVGQKALFFPPQQLHAWAEIFADSSIELIGHDVKQVLKTTDALKIVVHNTLFDVMIASYLLQSGEKVYDARAIIAQFLGEEHLPEAQTGTLFGVNKAVLAQELTLVLEVAPLLKNKLRETKSDEIMQKIECPLIPILAEMEACGIAIDKEKLKDLGTEVDQSIATITDTIYNLSGEKFNIASPIQLREVLFEKMKISAQGIKKGKTGLSTAAEQLEKLRGVHPIIDEIESYRELAKLKNTYIDVLPTLINKKTNRLHTSFNQTVAATGRLSSSDPNLQNIPVRTDLGREIRKAFVAEPGNVLLSADYSQLELRIAAALAGDKKMIEIFEQDLDIHTATAAAINHVPLDQVTREMRYAAKEINFGVLYGMGTYGLSWRAKISAATAKAFIEQYFTEFSGLKKYLEETIEIGKKLGYTETLFGRRRYLPDLLAPNFQVRSAAERMAINHPIQGTEADMIKLGMINVQPKLKDYGIQLLLQVHDELVFEVKTDQIGAVSPIIKEILEQVVKLKVPVKVELKQGKNWGEMDKIS